MTKQEAIQKLNSLKRIRVDTDVDGWDYYDANEDVQKCLDIAIECIEKQIPKKPKLGGQYRIYEWECPNCKSYFAELNDRPRHCVECGQAILWESDNE